MSALRVSRPGIAGTTLVDLGPSVGRITHTRGPVYGTIAVSGSPLPKPTIPQAGNRVGLRDIPARCGHLMPKNNETCARRAGHTKDDHRSARNLEAIRRRRWAEM